MNDAESGAKVPNKLETEGSGKNFPEATRGKVTVALSPETSNKSDLLEAIEKATVLMGEIPSREDMASRLQLLGHTDEDIYEEFRTLKFKKALTKVAMQHYGSSKGPRKIAQDLKDKGYELTEADIRAYLSN